MNTITEPTAASSRALLSACRQTVSNEFDGLLNVGKSLGNGGAEGDRTPDLMNCQF